MIGKVNVLQQSSMAAAAPGTKVRTTAAVTVGFDCQRCRTTVEIAPAEGSAVCVLSSAVLYFQPDSLLFYILVKNIWVVQ